MNEIRGKIGRKAAIIGISANTLLTIFNILVGILSGSYALISEGAHTLSDIATSIIAYLGFKIGQKPADSDHPLGHGRAEAIAGLIITMFLTVVGYEILRGAIEKILNPSLITTPEYLAALMALMGILVNLTISSYIIKLGKSINSPAIVADGQHQRVDIFSSVAILIGVIISRLGYPILDPIIGLFISLMIFKTAYHVCKQNIENIMGKIPSEDLIKEINQKANEIDGVYGAHNIKIDYMGSYAIVNLHIELDGGLILTESHKISHEVQNNIVNKIEIVKEANAHCCPLNVKYNHKQEIDK